MHLLFLTSYRLGDAVLSSGVLAQMIARHPGMKVTIVCGKVAAPIFAGVPGLQRVIGFTKEKHGRHWLGIWKALALTPFSLVVDLRGSAIAYMLMTRRRLLPKPQPQDCHRVEALAQMLSLPEVPDPKLWATPVSDARAKALIPNGGPVIGIGPAANWRGKQWRAERFAELADRLTNASGILPDARIAVFAAGHEREQAQPLIDTIPSDKLIDLVGETDPLEAFSCLERCALYVGNDSGLMHLAAAAQTPTVGLFGPSKDEHYAPWGSHCAVVRTLESYDEIVTAPDYNYLTTDTRMDSLSVDMVEDTMRTLWQRVGTAN